MTSTDSSAEDQAYFREIEQTFIRLRGAPLLLSPADWQLARDWRGRGIPLQMVLQTMEEVFRRRAERGRKGRIQGLRYLAGAVDRAWEKHLELVASGRREAPAEIDLPGRLGALAAALPVTLPDRERLAARVRSLEGSAESVEDALQSLDCEALQRIEDALEAEVRSELERSVDEALERLAARLGADERSRLRARLYRESLRRRAGLPLLSLFADEARRGR
jgi:hypothetical protein